MDILDQMEAWRKNARFISEQDFFSRMMFEIITNRNEIERLREALKDMDGYVSRADRYYLKPETLAALKEKE